MTALIGQGINLRGDKARFIVLIIGDVANNLLALTVIGPQVLLPPTLVLRDDGIRCTQDGLRGAVVLLQQNGARTRVVTLEVFDVANGCATEGIDGLIGVTHHA